jgi:fibronectin-binding autotransporter adhesin
LGAITHSGLGALTLEKTEAGTWRVNGSSNFTGITSIQGGVLEVEVIANGGSDSGVGRSSNAAANLSLNNATTLRYVGSTNATTDRAFTINSGTAGHGAIIESSGLGTLSFSGGPIIAYGTGGQTRVLTLGGTNTGANTFGKVVADNGTGATSLVKAGVGTWVLNQTNTYTGATTITGGILNFNSLAAGGANSSIGAGSVANTNLVLNGGTLQYTGSSAQTTNRLFTVGAAGGTIDSSGSNNANPLTFTGTGDLGASTTGNRTLTLTGSNTGANSIAGNIVDPSSGATSLTKSGDGTWVLTGTNTYTGTTTVNAGTLLVNGSTASGSAVTVNGGTLGGTGTVGGALTVASGGTVRGDTGTGTGTLTTGSVTINSGGSLFANIAAPGTNSTLALGSNTLDLKTNSKLALTGLGGFSNTSAGSYTLATLTDNTLLLDGAATTNGQVFGTYIEGTGATGPVVLDMSSFTATLAVGDTLQLSRSGNNLVLNFTPVPEPATVLGLGALGLGLIGGVRRWRAGKTPAGSPA